MAKVSQIISKTIIKLINIYQHTLSPDHGWGRLLFSRAGCRFYPSCSEYIKQSIIERGLLIGLIFGFKRLGRCHPFSRGGYDPVGKQ